MSNQIPQKSIDIMLLAIASRNRDSLQQMLHPSNKNWRKMFEDSQGVKLPRTVKGTLQVLDEWIANNQ